jgi:hypothetical protein
VDRRGRRCLWEQVEARNLGLRLLGHFWLLLSVRSRFREDVWESSAREPEPELSRSRPKRSLKKGILTGSSGAKEGADQGFELLTTPYAFKKSMSRFCCIQNMHVLLENCSILSSPLKHFCFGLKGVAVEPPRPCVRTPRQLGRLGRPGHVYSNSIRRAKKHALFNALDSGHTRRQEEEKTSSFALRP